MNAWFGNKYTSKKLSLIEPFADIMWYYGNCSDCEITFKQIISSFRHFEAPNEVQMKR